MTATPRSARSPGSPELLIGALIPAAIPRPPPTPAPLPQLPAPRLPAQPDPVLDIARLDRSGRLSARTLLRDLGWHPGHRVDIDVADGALRVAANPAGRHMLGARGDLALPTSARQLCGIAPGSAVVLAGYPPANLVVIHPASVVARLLHEHHGRGSEGR
jgi:hypothetical protein